VRKLFVLCLLAACKSGPQAVDAKSSAPVEAKAYYPLAVGNSWTYELRGFGQTRRETVQIVGSDGPWFLDDHKGRLRYEPDGVRDSDRYLLRTPVNVGSKWTAVDNLVVQKFEIVATDANEVTLAGTFTGCAVVRNEQPLQKQGRFVTDWTYCPRVGLTELVTRMLDSGGKSHEQTRMQLVALKVQ
jgi:hypothetical protein